MHLIRSTTHLVWDRTLAPAATIAPRDEVTVELANSSGGQLSPTSDRVRTLRASTLAWCPALRQRSRSRRAE
jgi:acetamidase/formamidase